MKATQRSVLSTAGFAVALAALVAPVGAGAQRVQQPGPDTKRVLVTAFRGDPEGGVKAADEIRNRIAGDFSIKQLMPISKKDIDATLIQSGYKPDSALNPNDIKELAKIMHADEVIDGTVSRTGNGYNVNARMFLPRDVALSQPLGVVETNDFGDAAKQIVHEYDMARKQLKLTQDCENGIRDGKPAVAIAAARNGIAAYPKATLARLCLASAYQAQKTTADSAAWRDSVIAVTKQTIALDKASRIAWTLQYDAYKTRNDTANGLQSLIGMMGADPTNNTLREQVIAELVNAGKASLAIPLTKQLVADNPGDPNYAKTYWLVLRAAHNYKESVPAGMAYVALDTAQADSNYYFRQVADLAADSMYAKAAEFAARGAARFPKSSYMLVQQATWERRAGQLPAARATLARALQLDPKASGANVLLAQIFNDAGAADSTVKYLTADATADTSNKARDAAYLLSFGNAAYRAANASKKAEDFQRALALVQGSDAISPSDNAAFLTGVTAFSLLQQTATALQTSKSCADAKAASNYMALTSTTMMRGGKVNAEAASQILGALGQYRPFVEASTKRYCK